MNELTRGNVGCDDSNSSSSNNSNNDDTEEREKHREKRHKRLMDSSECGIKAHLIPDDEQGTTNNNNTSLRIPKSCQVKLYSIEIWNEESGDLVGGELGYTVGTIYTSLTGFSCENSAGSVQLACLGKLLIKNGYEMWDLGMSLDYKITLGAKNIDRMDFLDCVKNMRVKSPCKVKVGGRELVCSDKVNCKEIFDACN